MESRCAMWLMLLGAFTSSCAAAPNIIQIVADDLGYNDLGYMNGGLTHTPHMDALVKDGIRLPTYYTYKVCSPSRASILTGRYAWGIGYYDMKGPLVVPTTYNLLPAVLKEAGYSTHAIGKWNLGHELRPYTPTRRGFDTFFGYYAACHVDVWYHGAPLNECGTNMGPADPITDLSNSTKERILPAEGLNGTYNEELFTAEAERLIHAHSAKRSLGVLAKDAPLYIYLAYHNVHGAANVDLALQAPLSSVDFYKHTKLDTYKVQGAMITDLDRGVGRVVQALDDAGLLENSVVTFCSDNGGPLDHATNWPLRGGKHTFWEGGLRAIAWVYSPLLPKVSRGVQWHGMMHSSDWLPTLAQGVAGIGEAKTGGPRPLDGHNLWSAWLEGPNSESPRTEVVHQVENDYCNSSHRPAPAQTISPFGPAIRMGNFKLTQGRMGDTDIVRWPSLSETPVPFGLSGGIVEPGTDHARALGIKPGLVYDELRMQYNLEATVSWDDHCDPWCLFDVVNDPSESHDLANDPAHNKLVQTMLRRLEEHAATGPDWAWPLTGDDEDAVKAEMCSEASRTGFFEPIRDAPPEEVVA